MYWFDLALEGWVFDGYMPWCIWEDSTNVKLFISTMRIGLYNSYVECVYLSFNKTSAIILDN